jgi:hypothetical protein
VTVLVPRPHAPAATEIVAASARSGEAAAAPDPVG